MRMRLNGLTIRVDLPRPRACQRFIEIDLPTLASWMTRASTSRLWLFSALAPALARTLRTSTAIAFFEKARTFIASSTLRPRNSAATRFSFGADPQICLPADDAPLPATDPEQRQDREKC